MTTRKQPKPKADRLSRWTAMNIAEQNRASRFAYLLSQGVGWYPAAIQAGVMFKPCKDLTGAFVYVLCDPDTAAPFYVGKSAHVSRPRGHIGEAYGPGHSRKLTVIRAILATGQEPMVMCIADCLTDDWAFDLEGRIINAMWGKLTNLDRPPRQTWPEEAAAMYRNMTPFRQWLRAQPRSRQAVVVYKTVARTCKTLIHAANTGIWLVPKV